MRGPAFQPLGSCLPVPLPVKLPSLVLSHPLHVSPLPPYLLQKLPPPLAPWLPCKLPEPPFLRIRSRNLKDSASVGSWFSAKASIMGGASQEDTFMLIPLVTSNTREGEPVHCWRKLSRPQQTLSWSSLFRKVFLMYYLFPIHKIIQTIDHIKGKKERDDL